MPLSPEDEAVIQGGLEAEALLGSTLFVNTVKRLNMESAIQWMETPSEAGELRERLYYKHKGLVAVEEELNALVAAKTSLLAHLRSETADNESE